MMKNNEVINILSRCVTKLDPNLVNTEFFESEIGDLVIFIYNENLDHINNMLIRFNALAGVLFSFNVRYSTNMCFVGGDEVDLPGDSASKVEYIQIIIPKKEYEKLNRML